MASGIVTSKDEKIILDLARDHLLCPVCLETCCTTPIYQCQNGHTICTRCIERLTMCPLCRCYFGRDKIRNRALEMMLNHLQVSCPNNGKGCKVVLKSAEVKEHLLSCVYGKFVICPSLGFEDCKEKVCSEDLHKHMLTAHKITSLDGMNQSVRITYNNFLSTKTLKERATLSWTPLLVKAFPDASPFLILCELDPHKNCMAKFICLHTEQLTNTEDGDDNDTAMQHNSYHVNISLENNAFLPVHVNWRGQTMTYQDMKKGESKGCFMIPLDVHVKEYQQELPIDVSTAEAPQVNAPVSLNSTNANINNGLPVPDNLNLGLPPRRPRNRNVERWLCVRFTFAKTAEELTKITMVPTQTACQFITLSKYTLKAAPIYRGIKCGDCSEGPVRGMRHKCMECQNFDLCSRCFDKGTHSHHVFMLIRDQDQNKRVQANFKRTFEVGLEEISEDGSVQAVVPKRVRKTPAKRKTPAVILPQLPVPPPDNITPAGRVQPSRSSRPLTRSQVTPS
ncbi:E3 ubiquitin-protein ligase Siah1 [Orchesella cincta]|uniref:RING-type E3 ubiquitin transferase n=1 Tax=Orchesella cincta TaxID=48709 RepID=A0A1D2N5S8_ORCCI|nr:E3 ubiquitin-protein ligase Siah1 [Orchesella cincta]